MGELLKRPLVACCNLCILQRHVAHRLLHSFPTRRSSDLTSISRRGRFDRRVDNRLERAKPVLFQRKSVGKGREWGIHRLDRKSTRLNSSHVEISYAVFCLKKKKRRR